MEARYPNYLGLSSAKNGLNLLHNPNKKPNKRYNMGWFSKLVARKVTPRRMYIRILRKATRQDDAPLLEEDTCFCAELINEDYLTGKVFCDGDGIPIGVAPTGITVKGRLFLQQLQSEERKESFRSKIIKVSLVVGGYILAALVKWIEKQLGL